MSFLSLSDDILIEVLGFVSALDVIQCRKVCGRLRYISNVRSLWINVLQRSSCILPRIDPRSERPLELEKMLRRAEIMEKTWMGTLRAAPEVLHIGRMSSVPIGFMGPYLVCSESKAMDLPVYKWYRIGPEGELQPAFEYQFASIGKEQAQKYLWDGCHIEAGTNFMWIAWIHYASCCTLHMAKITIEPGASELKVGVKPAIQLDHINVDVGPPSFRRSTIDHDFIYLRCTNDDGITLQLSIIQMETGKIILSPPIILPPGPLDDVFSFFVEDLRTFITPSYLIHVSRGREFEFFKLPPNWEKSTVTSPIIAQRTNNLTGSLPVDLGKIWRIYPTSPTLYTVVGLSMNLGLWMWPDDSHIVISTIDITQRRMSDPSENHPIVSIQKTFEEEGAEYWVCSNVYPYQPVVRGAKTHRDVETRKWKHSIMEMSYDSSDPGGPSMKTWPMEMPEDIEEPGIPSIRYSWFDPYAGRMVGSTGRNGSLSYMVANFFPDCL